jgi:lipopolysaccharide transport system permease protein
VAQYKQTILGPFWFLIQPLFSAGVFTVVFGKIANLPTDGLPQFLFYMAGNLVWSYFARLLMSTSNTFTANAGLFGKVYFPRLSIPVSTLFSGLIYFAIQFTLFLSLMAYFSIRGARIQPNAWLLALPVLIVMMAGLSIGVGVIISSATTKYRDLQQLLGFGTQLFMYATPIIYPLSMVPEKFKWIVLANPMTPIVEIFRFGFLGAGTVNPWHLAYSGIFTVVVLLFGILIFNRVERTFMDTV